MSLSLLGLSPPWAGISQGAVTPLGLGQYSVHSGGSFRFGPGRGLERIFKHLPFPIFKKASRELQIRFHPRKGVCVCSSVEEGGGGNTEGVISQRTIFCFPKAIAQPCCERSLCQVTSNLSSLLGVSEVASWFLIVAEAAFGLGG